MGKLRFFFSWKVTLLDFFRPILDEREDSKGSKAVLWLASRWCRSSTDLISPRAFAIVSPRYHVDFTTKCATCNVPRSGEVSRLSATTSSPQWLPPADLPSAPRSGNSTLTYKRKSRFLDGWPCFNHGTPTLWSLSSERDRPIEAEIGTLAKISEGALARNTAREWRLGERVASSTCKRLNVDNRAGQNCYQNLLFPNETLLLLLIIYVNNLLLIIYYILCIIIINNVLLILSLRQILTHTACSIR